MSGQLSISSVKNTLCYKYICKDTSKNLITNLGKLLSYDVVGIILEDRATCNLETISSFLRAKNYSIHSKGGCLLLAVRERKRLIYENRESQQCVKVQRIQLENPANDVEQICLRVTYPTDQIVSFFLTNSPEDIQAWQQIYEPNIKEFLRTKNRVNFFEPVVFGRFPSDCFPKSWQQVDVHMVPKTHHQFIDFLTSECRMIQINHVNCSDCNYIFVDNEFCNTNDVTDGPQEDGVCVEVEFTI